MLILALDCSLSAVSAALYDTDARRLLARRFAAMARGHAEALAPMVEAVMREAGVAMADIGRIAVTTGPGSFTGLRIGLAMARGLALALDIPLVALGTLKALSLNVASGTGRPVAAAIDAERGEVYLAVFDADGRERVHPQAARLQDAPELLPDGALLVGTGAGPLAEAARALGRTVTRADAPDLPNAAAFAAYAATLKPLAAAPEPLYLRAPYATAPAAAAP